MRKTGTKLLEKDLQSTHVGIVREKARRVESYFFNIAQSVELQSELARQFLEDNAVPPGAPPLFAGNTLTGRVRKNPILRKNLLGVQPYAIFHLAPQAKAQQARDSMNRLRRLGGYFAHARKSIPGCDSAYSESIYIYARVRFSGEAGEENEENSDVGGTSKSTESTSGQAWHYIVQLPLKSVLEPIHNVTEEMSASTRHLSNSIQTRTQQSATLVLVLTGPTLLVALGVAFFSARSKSRPLDRPRDATGRGRCDPRARSR